MLRVERGVVHVWRIPLAISGAELLERSEVLSPDELVRAHRFVFRKDREQFIAARGAVRLLLARYLHQPPDALRFTYGDRGKPRVVAPSSIGTFGFNVAHAGEWALLAIAPTYEVGVDVERVRGDIDLSSATFGFAASELAALGGLGPPARMETFFHCWTQKEAYVKAVGDGLAIPLNSFEVETGPHAGIKTICGDRATGEWVLQVADPAPGYFGVVAVRGAEWEIEFYDGYEIGRLGEKREIRSAGE